MKEQTDKANLIREMYQSGMTMEKIARLLNISKPRVHQIIQANKVVWKKREMVEELIGSPVTAWTDERVEKELPLLLAKNKKAPLSKAR